MQTQADNAKPTLHKIGAYLFNAGMLAGIATLTFGLISCGGGGGDSTPPPAGNLTPTITSITPSGMVASSIPKTLSLLGTNFSAGMVLSITNSSGVPYTISASSVTSSTVMTATLTINPAPSDNYARVTVKSSASASTSSSAVFGVAGTLKTLKNNIQPIFSASCGTCHTGAQAQNFLDLSSESASAGSKGPIGIPSVGVGCSSKFRVTPGDPRRSSSVLIDKIKMASTGIAACTGAAMPRTPTSMNPITAQELQDFQDIVDWVAGGAN